MIDLYKEDSSCTIEEYERSFRNEGHHTDEYYEVCDCGMGESIASCFESDCPIKQEYERWN